MFTIKKIKNIQFLISFALCIVSITSAAQVKIANTTGTANAAAMVDVESTARGFLLPRIALTSATMQLNNTTPEEGMMLFNTNNITTNNLKGMGVYVYYAQSWRLLQEAKDLDPVGVYKYSSSNTVTGYLKCDGSAVSRTTYADLFSLIGVSFGSGDSSSTFNLPDLRGRIFGCIGTGPSLTQRYLGNQAGNENNTLSEDQMPRHRHMDSLGAYGRDGNDGSFGNTGASVTFPEAIAGSPNYNSAVAWTDYMGGGAHSEMQPTVFAGNFFIKY